MRPTLTAPSRCSSGREPTGEYVYVVTQNQNNKPAFPRDHANDGHNGMSLRDYFAAKAMQGLMDAAMPMPEIAVAAYQMADKMMEARCQ